MRKMRVAIKKWKKPPSDFDRDYATVYINNRLESPITNYIRHPEKTNRNHKNVIHVRTRNRAG